MKSVYLEFFIVSFLALLAGCALVYEPNLSEKPVNKEKYSSDLSNCRVEARDRAYNAAMYDGGDNDKIAATGAGFGLIGALASTAVMSHPDPKQTPDYYKSQPQMIDECMSERGYKIIPN